jgi:ATP-dependent helicase/nuclease subunit A
VIGKDWPLPADTPAAGNAAAAAAAAPARPGLQRLPLHWSIPEPPSAPPMQRLQLATPDLSEAPEYSWVGLTARAVGTIVHAELRRLAAAADSLERPALEGATLDDSATRDYEAWLAELGVDASARPAARARILEALRRTLEDSRGRWLLAGAHRVAHSEWRLTGLHEGRLVNVVVDRMLVDQQGQRWIVDFKTSTHAGGAAEVFIDSEAQRYRAQLQRYAALASRLGPEPVRVALYFPLLGVFRELALE